MAARSRGVARRPRARGETLERLILDTTALITVERTTARLDEIVADADDVVIAAVTAAELLAGVTLADRRHEASGGAFVDALLATIPVEPYDLSVASAHAELLAHMLSAGRRRGAHDLLVAATARAHRRTFVTADAAAFEDTPGVTGRRLSPGD
jgi:tRNA(fMet)-specific endonuclease VapC